MELGLAKCTPENQKRVTISMKANEVPQVDFHKIRTETFMDFTNFFVIVF